ncbi:MAG: GerMN domain-containing protein [Christensenellales bacterium]|jgi:hypothetical protein
MIESFYFKRNKKPRIALTALLLCALIVLISGCTSGFLSPVTERQSVFDSDYIVDISPNVLTDTFETGVKTIYYRINGELLLAPVLVQYSLPVDKSKEEQLIEALISGPPVDKHELMAAIPADTQLVSLQSRDGYLEITLSNEFLSVGEDVPANWESNPVWSKEVMDRRRMATYSIINSITELGEYSRVLILIDVNGDGNGQRVNRSQFGLPSGEEDAPIEPLRRDPTLILSPQRACEKVLDAIITQRIDSVMQFIYFGDEGVPSAQAVAEVLYSPGLSSYDLSAYGDAIVRLDGQQAVLSVDFISASYGTGNRSEHYAYPLVARLVDNIWRIEYNSLKEMMED